ncbi:MAG: MMPL family transporter [Rhodospirillaceae bacterium]|nr:MMPL family transporter [Rhodospirillaceae bacterium]
MRIEGIAVSVVDGCRRRAPFVVAGAILAAILLGYYVATTIAVDTDQEHLVAEDLPWRRTELALDRAFPQSKDDLTIVVDARTPLLADEAARRLAERLAARPDLFHSVRRPDALPFLRRNGLLYLSIDELRSLTERLVEAQPLIAAVVSDPSLRGLFGALNFFLEGVSRGEADLAELAPTLTAFAAAAESVAAGRPQPVDWQSLFTGRPTRPKDKRRFVMAQPVLDYGALTPGAKASAFVREAAAELGLTPANGYRVRLTGSVALSDEEFATVGQDMGVALAVTALLVALELFVALRSLRLIAAILVTLLVGLVATAAFATAAFGSLNLISVAFAVLFFGLAVDFGIQFSVRFRDEHYHYDDAAEALRRCARGIGGALVLAAITTMAGFFSFVPTAYVGVSQLGVIAGVGMAVAVGLNLTLLPALLALLRPPGERSPAGYAWMRGPDRFLARNASRVLAALVVLVVGAAALVPHLAFDFNPLNLKDRRTESMSTLLDLMNDASSTPYTAKVLTASPAEAATLAARLEKLPEVKSAVTINSFVPEDQDEKLPLIEDAAMLLAPSLSPPEVAPPPNPEEVRATIAETVERLDTTKDAAASRLAAALRKVLAAGPAALDRLSGILVGGASREIAALGEALQAGPVGLADLPEELKRDWVSADGRAVVRIEPQQDARDNAALVRFVAAVQSVAPEASGLPVSIQEMGRTVVGAFRTAGLLAFAVIVVLLGLILRRAADVLLVLIPVLIGGLFAMATCVLIDLPLTFANIIVLPLLLGIGVAYGVYYVMNWRAGVREPLQSSMTRAVLFSALTTGTSFGSLALSDHPGTAGMGVLLVVSLGYTVVAAMVFLPAALAWLETRRRRRAQAPDRV